VKSSNTASNRNLGRKDLSIMTFDFTVHAIHNRITAKTNGKTDFLGCIN
jgi:hypothetical protein